MDLVTAVDDLASLPPAAFAGAVGLAAFVEYVFPPFPGDALVVAGTAVAMRGDGSPATLFAATTAGAAVGAALDLWVGRRLARTDWRGRLGPERSRSVERVLGWLGRWGPVVLVANRFVPGVRALFFVAAGVAGVPAGRALAASMVSAMAWNALLVGLGAAVSWNLDSLGAVLRGWSWAVGGFLVLLGVGLALWSRGPAGK